MSCSRPSVTGRGRDRLLPTGNCHWTVASHRRRASSDERQVESMPRSQSSRLMWCNASSSSARGLASQAAVSAAAASLRWSCCSSEFSGPAWVRPHQVTRAVRHRLGHHGSLRWRVDCVRAQSVRSSLASLRPRSSTGLVGPLGERSGAEPANGTTVARPACRARLSRCTKRTCRRDRDRGGVRRAHQPQRAEGIVAGCFDLERAMSPLVTQGGRQPWQYVC